jgi:hypothetical protein
LDIKLAILTINMVIHGKKLTLKMFVKKMADLFHLSQNCIK